MSPSSVSQLALLGRLLSHAYYFSLSLSLLNSSFFPTGISWDFEECSCNSSSCDLCACVRVHLGNAILSVHRLNSCVERVLMCGTLYLRNNCLILWWVLLAGQVSSVNNDCFVQGMSQHIWIKLAHTLSWTNFTIWKTLFTCWIFSFYWLLTERELLFVYPGGLLNAVSPPPKACRARWLQITWKPAAFWAYRTEAHLKRSRRTFARHKQQIDQRSRNWISANP